MRVTNSMMVSTYLNDLNSSLTSLSKLSTQMAKNRKFASISDDPVSVIYAMQSRFKLNRLEQHQRSVDTAEQWLTQTETGLNDINSIIKNLYESTIDASTDVKTGVDRENMSNYYKEMRDQLLDTLNSAFGDKFVYGNYNTTGSFEGGSLKQPFYVEEVVDNQWPNPNYEVPEDPLWADPSNPNYKPEYEEYITVTRQELYFCGLNLTTYDSANPANNTADENDLYNRLANEELSFTIGLGQQMEVTINGIRLVGTGPDNLYNMIDDLYTTIANDGSVEDIQAFITPLQDAQNEVLSLTAEIGGRTNRLKMIAARYEEDYINYTQMKSDAEDADQAELIMQYKMAQTVYNAALATGSYVIQQTLMDYLR